MAGQAGAFPAGERRHASSASRFAAVILGFASPVFMPLLDATLAPGKRAVASLPPVPELARRRRFVNCRRRLGRAARRQPSSTTRGRSTSPRDWSFSHLDDDVLRNYPSRNCEGCRFSRSPPRSRPSASGHRRPIGPGEVAPSRRGGWRAGRRRPALATLPPRAPAGPFIAGRQAARRLPPRSCDRRAGGTARPFRDARSPTGPARRPAPAANARAR